jgi:FMN phosphatase YigB (HAD superfamily)
VVSYYIKVIVALIVRRTKLITKEQKKLLMDKNLVEKAWEGLWARIKPDGEFPPNQPLEMRKAFYIAFYTCFDVMNQASKYLENNEASVVLTNIRLQCEREIKNYHLFESLRDAGNGEIN